MFSICIYIPGRGRDSPDLAILVLTFEVQTNSWVDVVNLPEPNEPCPKSKRMIAAGWGRDTINGTSRDTMWTVFQECLPLEKCGLPANKKQIHLCVGDSVQGDNSAFKGDSGGNVM